MQNQESAENVLTRHLVIPLLLTLTACGGGSGGLPASAATPSLSEALADRSITQVGVIQYEKEIDIYAFGYDDVRSNIDVRFYQYQAPLSADTISKLAAEYSIEESEYCKVWEYKARGELPERDQPHPITLESNIHVSAGEVLPVINAEGTLFEMHAESFGTTGQVIDVDYDHENKKSFSNLEEHLPSDTYIAIPGNSFPAFDKFGIPDVELVTDLITQNTVPGAFDLDVLTADSVVTWTASSNGDEYAWLHGYASVTATPGRPERFYCHVKDDGEFAFPPHIQNVFTEFEFPEIELAVWRDQFNYAVKDDALLVAKSTTRGVTGVVGPLFIGPTLWDW